MSGTFAARIPLVLSLVWFGVIWHHEITLAAQHRNHNKMHGELARKGGGKDVQKLADNCPKNWVYYEAGRKCYRWVKTSIGYTFWEAKWVCEKIFLAEMAKPETWEEAQWVVETFGPKNNPTKSNDEGQWGIGGYWLGLIVTEKGSNQYLRWYDSNYKPNYENWQANRTINPPDRDGYCVKQTYKEGKWVDEPCGFRMAWPNNNDANQKTFGLCMKR